MFGTKGRPTKTQSSREELISSRYNLVEPEQVYPLDGSQINHKYPDFQPWRHSAREDVIAVNHLQRGYFEAPQVGNELLSARNIMHQLLKSKSSLDELSSNLLGAIDVREQNNKVGQGSYKSPPRVTLTDQKRESWLKDLANSEVPLRRLARTIPHGVRNKALIEQCVNKRIPINRAVWFVRCVSTNELRGLKRKGGSNIEYTWVQEWTTQVVEFIEKLSHDYLKFETFQQAKESWKTNVRYMLRFASNLYIENLVDKESFKSWILTFIKSCNIYELPLAVTIIKMFWAEISKTDYIVKELTETLIIRYEKLSSCNNLLESKEITITDQELNDQIKTKLMAEFKIILLNSFAQSIDNFILPSNWSQLCPIVSGLLDLNDPKVKKNFDIINYRNESLMINYSMNTNQSVKDIVSVLDSVDGEVDYNSIVAQIVKENWKLNLKLLIQWSLTRFRYAGHRVYLCVEVCKKLKGHPLTPSKELEQEILNIVFDISKNENDVVVHDLFILLNEFIQCKLFKIPIYLRRLISSGLVYQSHNEEEKNMHASILKNLRSQKGSQIALILKNLTDSEEERFDYEGILKSGLEVLDGNSDYTLENIQFLDSIAVGLKLQLTEAYLSKILARENLFPLMTYRELQKILKTLLSLGDMRGLSRFILKALESQSLEREEFLLVSEVVLTYLQLTSIITDIDAVVVSLLQNSTRLMISTSLRKFWLKFASQFNSKHADEIDQCLRVKDLEYDLPTMMISLSDSDLNISYEELMLENNFHNNFQVLIRTLFNHTTDENKKKSSIILMKILKFNNPVEFNRILFVHIKKTYSSSTELFKYEPLWNLIISELVTIQTIVETFLSFNSQIHSAFVLELLFKEPSETEPYDFFRLTLLRDQFKRDNCQIMLSLVKKSLSETETKLESIQSDSAEIISTIMSDTTTTANAYKSDQLGIFLDILISDQKMVVNAIEFEDDQFKNKIIGWLDSAIVESSEDMELDLSVQSQLMESIKKLTRFNLTIVQLLFKLVLKPDMDEGDLLLILKAVIVDCSSKEKILSSVFELLDMSLKIRLIHFLESMFLSSTTFPSVSIDGQSLDLTRITDTLVTLSSGTQNGNLSGELVFSLDVSLDTLNKIIAQGDRDIDELYSAISLFLKIIIIHKRFLIDILIERNTIKENFLNNLVNLLTSKLVSQNLQLKNLLYDLLLSIKSSMNELNSSQMNNVKLPVSIVNLPSISSTVGKVQSHGQNKQNLQDFNIVNNLFLFHKTTASFHEFNIKPFDMVEDSNPIENLNDTAISLQLFEASMERKNPT